MYSNTQNLLMSGIGSKVASKEKRADSKGARRIVNDAKPMKRASPFTYKQACKLEAFLLKDIKAGIVAKFGGLS